MHAQAAAQAAAQTNMGLWLHHLEQKRMDKPHSGALATV